jgi:hypothetical protein
LKGNKKVVLRNNNKKSSPEQYFAICSCAEDPGLGGVEDYVLDTFETFDGVASEDFEGQHDSILHDFRVILEVEDVYSAIVGGRCHQRVLLMEVDVGDGFFVELHGLVWFCRKIDIVTDELNYH